MNKILAHPTAFRTLIAALIGIVIVNFIDAQVGYDAIFSIDTAITILDDPLWSSDSNTFTFMNLGRIQDRTQNDIFRGVELTQPLWDAYSMAILQNIQSNIWPFQPQLSIAEQGLYQPSPDGFIHTSPDGNYIVFPRENLDLTTGGARYFLTIGNRQESTFEETSYELPIINPPHDFYTIWSENDLAFGVFHISVAGQVKILYFNIIDPSNLSSTIVHEFGDFIGEQEYITFDSTTDVLYDISDDGEKFLIAGREFLTNSDYDPYTASTHPIIWTPLESNQDQVLEQFDTNSIYDMSFAPNDESQLLLVHASGLFLYDLITNDTRILQDSFAHEELNYAAFSPDGKWLTLQVAEELRFIHIPPLLASVACSIIHAAECDG